MFALSKNVCKDSVMQDWHEAVEALVTFRNEYVHSGTMYAKEYLDAILSIDMCV